MFAFLALPLLAGCLWKKADKVESATEMVQAENSEASSEAVEMNNDESVALDSSDEK